MGASRQKKVVQQLGAIHRVLQFGIAEAGVCTPGLRRGLGRRPGGPLAITNGVLQRHWADCAPRIDSDAQPHITMTLPATGIQAQHQLALDQGRFLIQHCGACSRHVYFPRELCPHCGALGPALVAPQGAGTVAAVTTVRRKAELGGDYAICMVELDEGVRLMSRVEGLAPAAVTVGLRVQARVAQANGHGLVVFDAQVSA